MQEKKIEEIVSEYRSRAQITLCITIPAANDTTPKLPKMRGQKRWHFQRLTMLKKLALINFSLLICFFLQTQTVLGCGCVSMPEPISQTVNNYLKNSDATFLGKVIFVGYRKMSEEEIKSKLKDKPKFSVGRSDFEILVIKFEVSRWWKGFREKEITLLTDTMRASDGYGTSNSCEVGFEVGKENLVFAKGSNKDTLQTHSCSGTGPSEYRNDFLTVLGKGKTPKKWYSLFGE